MEILSGAHTTVITPYKKDGNIDYDALKKYVEWYGNNGCTGLFSVCQSSELDYLQPDEIVSINRFVYENVQSYNETHENKMCVVSSGHILGSIEEQAKVLNRVAESGTDALILITNRFDIDNKSDEKWIEDAERLLKMIPDNIPLGLYECPRPYKRLVSPKILEWCLKTGRFVYMKDTCCDLELITERLNILSGSKFKLYNANCQTLLGSLKAGASGYCGIMCNFHPKIYSWITENYNADTKKSELIQSLIGSLGFTEVGLPYPLSAKYNMCLCGIKTENTARNRESAELTPYAKNCIEQMKLLTEYTTDIIIS